jgi:sigma-B regulation protein RsbU (phosphoserine phosphatase)
MLRAFAEELRPLALDPGALLSRLNRALMDVLRQAGTLLFVTAAYVVVDAEAATLAYGQAGHPTGFLLRCGGAVDSLPAGGDVEGPALGLIENYSYVSGRDRVEAGDTAILFTDGVFEVRDPEGREWGLALLREEIRRRAGEGGLLASVASAAGAHAAGGVFDDDVCLLSLEVLG